MTKIKKLLCLFTAALVLAAFTSCGDANTPASDGTEAVTTTAVDEREAVTTTTAADEPEAVTIVSETQAPEETEAVTTDSAEEQVEETVDEELRYDVKEVLYFASSWNDVDPDLTYPNAAVSLSNAKINTLLDALSELEFSDDTLKGSHAIPTGPAYSCVIVTDDNRYHICIYCGSTIGLFPDDSFTIESRENMVAYYFSDNPIYESIYDCVVKWCNELRTE